MKPKSPQEKKALSYRKDRRNTFGGNDKSSRESISKRKAGVNRVFRRKVKGILVDAVSAISDDAADILESKVKSIRRPDWKKAADKPLAEVVEQKLRHRADHAGHGKSARKAVLDFLSGLEIETFQEIDGRWIAEACGMDNVSAHGQTEAEALMKCRTLAEVAYLELRGTVTINEISDEYTSLTTK